MKFLVDENVKLRLAKLLAASGHDVLLVKKGSSDKEIGRLAKKESRIILTHDNDFALSRLFCAKDFSGIVLIKVFPPSFAKIAASLENLLREFKTGNNFEGKLIVLIDEKSFWVE
jgi:predicted nuclease of predicted toxin-antitoxin system